MVGKELDGQDLGQDLAIRDEEKVLVDPFFAEHLEHWFYLNLLTQLRNHL
jgi:hypothetical protein